MNNDLHQTEVWFAKGGERFELAEMDQDHRKNLLAFLRRNAERLKFNEEIRYCMMPGPSGDAACDAFDSALDEMGRTPASEWIEECELVQELVRLVELDAPSRRRRALAMPVPAGAIPASWRRS